MSDLVRASLRKINQSKFSRISKIRSPKSAFNLILFVKNIRPQLRTYLDLAFPLKG